MVQSGRDERRAVLERELLSLVDRPDWGTLCIHTKGRLLKLRLLYRFSLVFFFFTIHDFHTNSLRVCLYECWANLVTGVRDLCRSLLKVVRSILHRQWMNNELVFKKLHSHAIGIHAHYFTLVFCGKKNYEIVELFIIKQIVNFPSRSFSYISE